MKGVWKWPLGGHLSPTVARLYGWANVIVGLDSLVLAVLVIVLPQLLDNAAQARLGIVMVLSAVVGVLVIGCYLYARSILLSRRQPA
jgi:Na+/melibiose symporter-like transporter